MTIWPSIVEQIQHASGLSLDPGQVNSVSGGCINSAYLLGSKNDRVFIKINRAEQLSMFEAEAAGLAAMAEAGAIYIPAVFCTGTSGDKAFIAMQAITLGPPKHDSYREFGFQLAAMHRHHESRYGASLDNTIGSTPQPNNWSTSWFDFWRKHRLGYQLALAEKNRAPTSLIDAGSELNACFEALFETPPEASCLHGDLWSGNWGFDQDGRPVLFDPAHYFGDREADLAMTDLFGGPPADFYRAYDEVYPLQAGSPLRKTFYNIYHVLNHYNLFGGGYATQANNMIQNVLSELR